MRRIIRRQDPSIETIISSDFCIFVIVFIVAILAPALASAFHTRSSGAISTTSFTITCCCCLSSNNQGPTDCEEEEEDKDQDKGMSSVAISCKFCDESFPSRNKLFDHLRQQHSDLDKDGRLHRGSGDSGGSYTGQISGRQRTLNQLEDRSRLKNLDWRAYYERQCTETTNNDVLHRNDLDKMEEVFRTPLPVSFRISKSSNMRSDDARQIYVDYLHDVSRNSDGSNNSSTYIRPSPFFDPSTVQVAVVPIREWNEEAKRVLSDAQDVGAIHRQECSSLVPVSLLLSTFNNENNDRINVLDLCAAPGSKTLQLLDELLTHQYQEQQYQNEVHGQIDIIPNMMVVANDSNRSRLMTLIRRSRQNSGRSNVIFNSSDGRFFPSLRKWGGYKVKFDAVLADVPCSGDGTFRKQGETEWAKWKTSTHLKLHKLQMRLLERALLLVKKGGRVIYSTCSLDPIENEAVVASTIAKMGGPSVYRITELPKYLHKNSNEQFPYLNGATHWSVPHPNFSSQNPTMFDRYEDVPNEVRKHVSPSMFPPTTRICNPQTCQIDLGEDQEEHVQDNDPNHDDMESSRPLNTLACERDSYSLSFKDSEDLNSMLRNCCRILPQHLDSGGFFCAVIERVSPSFYAICCPQQRDKDNITNKFHGRIYHPIESPGHIRSMVADIDEEVYFEGHSTLEGAIKWLHQHKAFLKEKSSTVLSVPDMSGIDKQKMREKVIFRNRDGQGKNRLDKGYTPFFRRPHPVLVREFCDFYGLKDASATTTKERVDRITAEDLVIIGGGDRATEVTNWVDVYATAESNDSGRLRDPKFFRLSFVSQEIRSLFKGAAKFNPVECGLTLTTIPVPSSEGANRAKRPTFESSVDEHRSVKSNRFALTDEAVEMIGSRATKRVIDLNYEQVIELLRRSYIGHKSISAKMDEWPTGGVIARYAVKTQDDKQTKTIYLSCALRLSNKPDSEKQLVLLTENRVVGSWLRLLENMAKLVV